MTDTMQSVLLLGGLCLSCLGAAGASEPDHCGRCGCQAQVKKVCRLVCETKKVTEIQYDCKCEDFCTPGRSKHCGLEWECDENSLGGKSLHHVWLPRCGQVRTRTVLTKHEVIKQVPSTRCVVEYVCQGCCGPEDSEAAANNKPFSWGLFRR